MQTHEEWSAKFRYPDDVLMPERVDVKDAIDYADKILKFVLDKIAEMESGQKNIFK